MPTRPTGTDPWSLALVNTTWIDAGTRRDLLDDPSATALLLRAHGFADGDVAALRTARAALRTALDARDPVPLNAVLARGRIVRMLGPDGPTTTLEIAPGWAAAWAAAADYLDLLAAGRARLRRCGHDACIRWFYDTSRNGTRRWCSMASCGNRVKARRHYARRHPHRPGER